MSVVLKNISCLEKSKATMCNITRMVAVFLYKSFSWILYLLPSLHSSTLCLNLTLFCTRGSPAVAGGGLAEWQKYALPERVRRRKFGCGLSGSALFACSRLGDKFCSWLGKSLPFLLASLVLGVAVTPVRLSGDVNGGTSGWRSKRESNVFFLLGGY